MAELNWSSCHFQIDCWLGERGGRRENCIWRIHVWCTKRPISLGQ